MSQRALARALAGPKATDAQVENERRQIARYLSGENVPSPEKSRRLAAILGGDADAYTEAKPERLRRAGQLREMAAVVDGLSRLVEDRAGAEEVGGAVGRLELRLAVLEGLVDKQGKDMTAALRAATRRLARIEELLEPQARGQARRAQ